MDSLTGWYVLTEFQFTHPGGVRPTTHTTRLTTSVFQFTHPGGVRLIKSATAYDVLSFNSRTREGCD